MAASAPHSSALRAVWSYRLEGPAGTFHLYRGHSLRSMQRIAEVPATPGDVAIAREVDDAGDRGEGWIYQLRFVRLGQPEVVLGTVRWEPPGMSPASAPSAAGGHVADPLLPLSVVLAPEGPGQPRLVLASAAAPGRQAEPAEPPP